MPYANDAYLRSLDASSADIKRQVSNALTEVSRQRDVSLAQAAQVPGAASAVYNEGAGRLNTSLASIGATAMPSVSQAFQNSKASYGRVSGLLGQGFKERGERQAGGVRGLGDHLSADLRERAADYTARRQAEDRARAFQAQEGERQRALQIELAERQAAAQAALQEQAMKDLQADLAAKAFFAAISDGISPEESRFFGLEPATPLGTRFNNAQLQSLRGL